MKIYLSKSNLCDPVVVSAVRKAIEKNNHELVEFRGGTYDISNVTSADMVIVVSAPGASDNVGIETKKLGRGIFGEVKAALAKPIPVKVVLGESNGSVLVADVLTAKLFNTEDWRTEYGVLTHNPVGEQLQTILAGSEEEILLADN